MLFFAAVPPVSYSQQVAPLLALHCYSCHGDSGGLSMRTHASLLLGGNLGKVILPGNPEGSLLVHFIEGRRGPKHRMPQDGRPLSDEQIQMVRRWIAEGAKQDVRLVSRNLRTLPPMALGAGQILRVRCRVKTAAFITITARDPRTRRALFTESATVKSPKDKGDSAVPGEVLTWELRAGTGWPKTVLLELLVEYAAGDPKGTEFSAEVVGHQ